MSENSRPRWFLPVIFAALVLITGCATVDGTAPTAVGTTPNEDTKARIEQWKCGDYFDGCGFLATNCVTLTASLRNGTGRVRFGEIVEDTTFNIQGLERRWDWCPNYDGYYDCAFVISVEGRGRYFNFASTLPDSDGVRRVKPTDLFKCHKR